jgi:hypothetical protein
MVFPLLVSSAYAFSGRANLNYNRGESFEEGKKVSTSDRFNQNYFLNFGSDLTELISYRLSFRANLLDQSVESEGVTRERFRRAGEGGLDLVLNNPFFTLTSGYVRRENWDSARLKDETRTTTEFYYSRLDIVTRDFPSFYFEYDRSHVFDYLPVSETDSTNTKYSGSSYYSYRNKGLTTFYNIDYTRTENDTPLSSTRETVTDSYSGAYDIKYAGFFWRRAIDVSAEYRGNLAREETTFKVAETGELLRRRTPRVGLHARVASVRDVPELQEQPDLTNMDYETQINDINIGKEDWHNIGIELDTLEETKTVDRIFVYVFVPFGTVLRDPPGLTDWSAFKSETNPPEPMGAEWDEVPIQQVILHPPEDVPDINPDVNNPNVYLYEIVFSEPQQGVRFYKVLNELPVSLTGLQDVFVTEIEAHGLEVVTAGETKEVEEFFAQGVDFRLGLRPWERLQIVLNYNISRTDSNPASFLDSVEGIYRNVFSKDFGQTDEDTRITVRRSYGSSIIWRTLRLLTTTLRASRNEFFDNQGLTDSSANTYLISFSSSPLPTLDAYLTAVRNESFEFGEKRSTSHSLLLTLGTKLYREVKMTTDTGYSKSKNHKDGTVTTNEFVRGTIDARVTTELFTHLTYGLEWTSSEDNSTFTKDGSVVVSYRPAKLISFSGNFRIRDTEDETTTTEGVAASWLPVPVLRVVGSYQHRNVSPGPETTDSVSTSVRWDVTKFIDVRVSLNYTRSVREIETSSRNVNVNLNGRF